MQILTQDRLTIVNTDRVDSIEIYRVNAHTHEIRAAHDKPFNYVVVGTYESEAQAKEVLQAIYMKFDLEKLVYAMPTKEAPCKN